MKVLRPGRQPAAEWSREVTCTGHGNPASTAGNGGKGCDALLLVGKDDLFKTVSLTADRARTTWFITFKCPECGAMTDLGQLDRICSDDIPPEVVAALLPRAAWEALQFQRTDAAQQVTAAPSLPPVIAARVKPADCTCDYPKVVCRNMCGHPNTCPTYDRWYRETFGRSRKPIPANVQRLVAAAQQATAYRCHRCGSTAAEGNPYCIHCDLGGR